MIFQKYKNTPNYPCIRTWAILQRQFKRKKEPPPPIIVNDEEEYEVEEILDKRKHYGKIQYLIKWKGYPLSEASWELEENLNCQEILRKINKSNI